MARVELTNKQTTKQIKSGSKNTTGITLILAKKNLQGKELLQVCFFLRARQKSKRKCFCQGHGGGYKSG